MDLFVLDRINLPKEIANKVKDMIINKQLIPGDKLPSEAELCSMLGVSRPTIREAVKILVAENVVEIMRGRGTFVTSRPGMVNDPLGVSFMNQKNMLYNLFETRLIIEPKIAYLAAERATKKNIEKMAEIIERTNSTQQLSDDHRLIDIQFHNAVSEATHNDILHRIIPIINDSIQQGYAATSKVPGSFEKAIAMHNRVFEAIKTKDSVSAEKEMKRHLEETMKDILNK